MITVVGNLKGGTGKSTVVFNLALWRIIHGETDTAVCDLDPQATVRDAADVRFEEGVEPLLTVSGRLPKTVKGEVLVDVGMSDTPAMRGALARADWVLIPVAPSQADVWSTQHFLEIVADSVKRRRKKPELITFLSRADTHPGALENDEAISALKSIGGMKVMKSRLSQRIAFRRSFSEGLAVFELEPRGKAADELDRLAKEFFKKRR